MHANCSENEKLFAKSVSVSLKDVYTKQSRTSHMFLTIEWQSTSLYDRRKILAISLTDNNDPFFLYNLHLSEEDFVTLQDNLDLNIDFSSFPQYIIDYIEKCLHEEKNPQPKFLLVFTVDRLGNAASSELQVIEHLQFRNMIHLYLKFIPAPESVVQKYLISSFMSLKEEKRQFQYRISSLEQEVTNKTALYHQELESKAQELELLRKSSNVELSMKDSKYALEITEERNRLQSSLNEAEVRFKTELKEKEQHFRKQIENFETKVSTLENSNKELRNKNKKQESTIKELRNKNNSSEDEIRKLKDSIRNCKQEYDDLSSELRGKQLHIQQQNEQIRHLEQELQHKKKILEGLKDQTATDFRKLEHLKEELGDVAVKYEMSEKTVASLKDDKRRQDDIIFKLQARVREEIEKLKDNSELREKLEKEVKEKSKYLLEIQTEIREMKIFLEARNTEVKTLNGTVSVLEKRVVELETQTKIQENVVKYLNRQLSDNCIVTKYTPPSGQSPSSIAQMQLEQINFNSRKSLSSHADSPVFTSNNTALKSGQALRNATPSGRKSTSTPSRHQMTGGTDSAYFTSPSGYTNQATPITQPTNSNVEFNPSEFEIDPAALSAAFGDQTPKTSTAKKKTNPVKSAVPKVSKKR